MHASHPFRRSVRSRAVAVTVFMLIALVTPGWSLAGSPSYDSERCRAFIEKMLDAHGGIERWQKSPAISFSSHLKVDFGNGNWAPYWEEVTVETPTRRAYVVLKNADGSKGRVAYDGRQAWSAGTLQGVGRAPARFTAWRNFYLFNLPWMTQDDGVNLAEAGRGTVPNETKEYVLVKMTFDAGTGDTPKDYYTLYIDPETHRLHAAEYVMTYKSMMRGRDESPPSVFVWNETQTVGGLVVPKKYTVHWKDGSVAVKDGEVTNWNFAAQFDPSRLAMPTDGQLDESTP